MMSTGTLQSDIRAGDIFHPSTKMLRPGHPVVLYEDVVTAL